MKRSLVTIVRLFMRCLFPAVISKDARGGRENATPDVTSPPRYAIILLDELCRSPCTSVARKRQRRGARYRSSARRSERSRYPAWLHTDPLLLRNRRSVRAFGNRRQAAACILRSTRARRDARVLRGRQTRSQTWLDNDCGCEAR